MNSILPKAKIDPAADEDNQDPSDRSGMTPIQPSTIREAEKSPVKQQQKLLADIFAEHNSRDDSRKEQDYAKNSDINSDGQPSNRLNVFKTRRTTLIKSLIAIAVAFAFVWAPVQRLFSTTSAQAIVNARVITIRAPIDGIVSSNISGFEVGRRLHAKEKILTIRNLRADTSQINTLERSRARIITNIAIFEATKKHLQSRISAQTLQLHHFQRARIKKLQIRIGEIDTRISAAKASREVTVKATTRAITLIDKGIVSPANLEKIELESRIAGLREKALRKQRQGTAIEISALKNGVYIGDSYNDIPLSAQRRFDNEQKLVAMKIKLNQSKLSLDEVNAQLAREKKRHTLRSTTSVHAAVNGRIWEVLAMPGEHVSRGQVLFKVLDCSQAVVTAAVSETVYHKLKLGMPATFRPRNGGDQSIGRIVSLSGLAAVSSNNAISPSALSKEPYFVTLKFPGPNRKRYCNLGQSGIVTFDTPTNSKAQSIPNKSTQG